MIDIRAGVSPLAMSTVPGAVVAVPPAIMAVVETTKPSPPGERRKTASPAEAPTPAETATETPAPLWIPTAVKSPAPRDRWPVPNGPNPRVIIVSCPINHRSVISYLGTHVARGIAFVN